MSSIGQQLQSGYGTHKSGSSGTPSAPALVLASQSPQRRQLLQQLGFEPQCMASDIDETPGACESAQALVLRLAIAKAAASVRRIDQGERIASAHACVVLAADTVIDLQGKVLGKPGDEAECISMLLALSDREHQVHSGVCVQQPGTGVVHSTTVTTHVRFATISVERARKYWHTGEPEGKAGSYAIQGIGAQFVVHLSGSYSNVVGLPLFETAGLLGRVGLISL